MPVGVQFQSIFGLISFKLLTVVFYVLKPQFFELIFVGVAKEAIRTTILDYLKVPDLAQILTKSTSTGRFNRHQFYNF